MRKLIFLTLLVPFSVFGQITISENIVYDNTYDEWVPIDTISYFRGDNVVNDSVMWYFYTIPEDNVRFRLSDEYVQINDSSYVKKTKKIRGELMRSRNIVVSRLYKYYELTEVPNSDDDILIKALKKAKELNIKNNNTFWNYSIISDIINRNINDTIQ